MAYILTENRREYLRDKIIAGAKLYGEYLLNKRFLITCEGGETHTIWFPKEKFLHLTGVKSDLNERRFYDACINNRLSIGNIKDNQKYNWSTLKGKADRIANIHRMLFDNPQDSLFLINLHTNTRDYPVAIRNDVQRTCVGFVTESNKIGTLRKSSVSKDSEYEKKIVRISVKEINDATYEAEIYPVSENQ